MLIGNIDPIFGRNVRYLRTLSYMSQQTLSILVGLKVDEIQNLEESENPTEIDFRILNRLCAVFALTANEITCVDLEDSAFALTTP